MTEENNRKRISPADLVAGIRGDADLCRVFSNVEVIVGEELKGVNAAVKYTKKDASTEEAVA